MMAKSSRNAFSYVTESTFLVEYQLLNELKTVNSIEKYELIT